MEKPGTQWINSRLRVVFMVEKSKAIARDAIDQSYPGYIICALAAAFQAPFGIFND